jgi:serine/threonine-protein kinase
MSLDLEFGTLLADRYRIERELGRGGMATLYLANDLTHRRKVAIKVLRPELAATLGAERFQREIEIAAGLTHPHILPIHDSGQVDGLLYFVMPYVEGESLRGRLDREGELPVGDAVRIARQVADALAYAHAHGVIHRDIKPENILLEGRHAVLADFGIARAIGAVGAERLTKTGFAVGTPAYMSPEQGTGGERVDARADIYALGCVLYEMLAGRAPLTGRTAQATLARRLTETPPPLQHQRETVPPELERAVARALARTPADRFPSADQLARALETMEPRVDTTGQTRPGRRREGGPLRRWLAGLPRRRRTALATAALGLAAVIALLLLLTFPGDEEGAPLARATVAAEASATRIAVLPFEDLSADGRLRPEAAGFTRELIRELTAVGALDVISYSGVKAYQGEDVPLDSIARRLGAGTLVGANVEESEGRLRILVNLIDPETGINLASTRVERPRTELFALQDDVAREVAHFLRQRLGTEVTLRGRRAATGSVEAWGLVQRAEELREDYLPLWRAGEREAVLRNLEEADALLARAEGLDPRWTEPIVLRGWLAETRARLISDTPGQVELESARRALAHAERALEVNPESAAALELRGTVLFQFWQHPAAPERTAETLDEAERSLRDAVAFEPSRAGAWSTLSDLLLSGRGSRAAAKLAAERAYEEDAFLADAKDILVRLINVATSLGRYEEAMHWTREGRERFPETVNFVAGELIILTHVADSPEHASRAWELQRDILELSPSRWRDIYLTSASLQVAGILARVGLPDSARAVIDRTLAEATEESRAWASLEEAYAWTALGERDEALRALQGFLKQEPAFRATVAESAWFETLRDDPRFQELVAAG